MINVNGYNNNYQKNLNYIKNNEKKAEHEKKEPLGQPEFNPSEKADSSFDSLKIDSVKEKDTELSKTAQDYLKKLKEKFPDMDFIIEDFSTDEEADKLLAKGKGKYNVLITPDLLEKMAAEEETAAKYEGIIENSVSDMEGAKEKLGEDADMIEKFGVSVNSNGEITYHAKLIEGLTDKDGNSTVKASTIGELLDRLNETKESQAEKLAEIRKKKAEEAEKAEKAAEEKAKEEEKAAEITLSDVEKIADGIVDWADELREVTKFSDFSADA